MSHASQQANRHDDPLTTASTHAQTPPRLRHEAALRHRLGSKRRRGAAAATTAHGGRQEGRKSHCAKTTSLASTHPLRSFVSRRIPKRAALLCRRRTVSPSHQPNRRDRAGEKEAVRTSERQTERGRKNDANDGKRNKEASERRKKKKDKNTQAKQSERGSRLNANVASLVRPAAASTHTRTAPLE